MGVVVVLAGCGATGVAESPRESATSCAIAIAPDESPRGPTTLHDLAAQSDALAVMEITERFDESETPSAGVTFTRRMATARVIEPIVGVAAGEDVTIYVSLRETEAGSGRDIVLGENADSLLTVGSQIIGGIVVNDASRDEFEIAGGLFMAHNSEAPTLISAQSQSCLTDDEQEMQQTVEGNSTSELVELLNQTVQDPPGPTSVEPPATTVAGGG